MKHNKARKVLSTWDTSPKGELLLLFLVDPFLQGLLESKLHSKLKPEGSGVDRLAFEYQLCCVQSVQTSYLTSLNLSFLICEMELTAPTLQFYECYSK